ncbi:lyase family protein [Sciscionella sediminilitoris]|uniref:lyase family protein n=1 Tax=Sciscionella sediminilitoris TaxID=1445613 RepID=UPI00056312F1|nr:lyase family protein [Sciscionella sp. SE31]
MTDLFWPGAERAGEPLSEPALLRAMLRVESAWLGALGAPRELDGLVTEADIPAIARAAEAGGNPVIPLLAVLRERLPADVPLHQGLTSQDVLDTALMLGARELAGQLLGELDAQIGALCGLVRAHRATPMIARTLTQHAEPTTFGLRAATWLRGLLDARDRVRALRFPAQIGGAVGNLAGIGESALELAATTARALGLEPALPWHTARAPVTRIGEALLECTDAFGRIANDVLTASRPEIGELAEPRAEGRGGSSAMPHKVNPVLSVLIRRAALAAPAHGAQLHLAAAASLDERPDGAWHVEWASLRTLGRNTAAAANQLTELLGGLEVRTERMAENLEFAVTDLGATEPIITELLRRAEER